MTMNSYKQREAGFTLIELSIVLIIIGLIVVGVLVGQDLIDAAKMRAQIQQIQQYDTLVSTFRTKYDGLPGDLLRAPAFFTLALPGDGDNRIELDANADGTVDETANFWNHISLAGMTPRNYLSDQYETTKLDRDLMGTFYGGGSNSWALGVQSPAAGALSWGDGFTGLEAYQIDSKLDDAAPATGYVRAAQAGLVIDDALVSGATGGLGAPVDAVTTGGAACVDAAPPTAYMIDDVFGNEPDCPVRVRMNVG